MLKPKYKVVLAGIDTLIVNARGQLKPEIAEFLDALQQEAIEQRDERQMRGETRLDTLWTIAGYPLLIAPHGAGRGMWRWLLSCPALTLEIGHGQLNGIAARARLSSAFLWEQGYRQAWALTADLLREMGLGSFQVSELHLCADIAGLSVAKLREGDFVRRGHVTRWHQEDALILELVDRKRAVGDDRPMVDVVTRYREQETVNFSLTAPHAAAIYNKPREIRLKSRDKLWFADLWRANGWNEADPIARVEMRYEREVLHELGCEGVEDTFERLDNNWQYSTHDWLRHTVPTKDKHRERWPTSTWWQVVQSACFGKEDAAPGQREKTRAFHENQMLGALLGYAESWLSWKMDAIPKGVQLNIYDALEDIANRAGDYYDKRGTDFHSNVLSKRKKIGFADEGERS